MKELTQDELRETIENADGWCVSLFMPTHHNGLDNPEDRIRYKNLLRQAEERLVAGGMRQTEARDLLARAAEHGEDGIFWQHQLGGLAVFASKGWFRHYLVSVPLEELVIVNKRFHIKPLFPLLTGDSEFYVLALSKHMVKLFKASRFTIREQKVPNAPRDMADALKFDDYDVNRRFYQRASKPERTAHGGRVGQYYGQGVGEEDTKDQVLRYFRVVDQAIHEQIASDNDPLVLAAVDYLIPIYAEANTYPYLEERGVTGNPETVDPEDLRNKAWEIVVPGFEQKRTQAADHYNELAKTPRASNEIEQVVPAAYQGRVETLFVPVDAEVWGEFDPDNNVAKIHPAREACDQDLLDLAATQTLLHGGAVYGMDMTQVPGGGTIAAVFRYALPGSGERSA